MTVSATQFPTKWCPFQPLGSKTVGGDTFLVAKSVLFRRREKHQNITKCNYVPNINVNNNINCWYVVLILLHCLVNYVELDFSMGTVLAIFTFFWMDNAPCPPPLSLPICKTFNIYHKKKDLNKNYVEFYFSMGIVLVIFSFFWTVNNLVCVPPLCGMFPVFSTPQLFTYFRA